MANEAKTAESTPEAARAKPKPKRIPGTSVGVRVTTGLRMVKLATPICPYSRLQMEKDPKTGAWAPKQDLTPNCQLEGPGWEEACEARGHDPYYRTRVWYTTKDEWTTDEDGNDVLVGQKTIRHFERVPNIVQVPAGIRHGSGNMVRQSLLTKGRKRLSEIGYEEVCQFRNCQSPVSRRFRSRKYGDYCSADHLSLVAFDQQEVAEGAEAMPIPASGARIAVQAAERRRRKLLRTYLAEALESSDA